MSKLVWIFVIALVVGLGVAVLKNQIAIVSTARFRFSDTDAYWTSCSRTSYTTFFDNRVEVVQGTAHFPHHVLVGGYVIDESDGGITMHQWGQHFSDLWLCELDHRR